MVVPEQFNSRTAFADSKRAGSKYSDPGLSNQVETRCNRQKLRTCLANGRGRTTLHGGSDGICRRLQPVVLGDFQCCEPVALKKSCPYCCCARRSVGKHPWKLSTQCVEVPSWVYSCFIQSPVFKTLLNRICWVTRIARCNSSSETSPASFLMASVPVPSDRNSTSKPRCIA